MNFEIENLQVGNGEDVRLYRGYGVGIDTHKKFIQVCVLCKQGDSIKQYEHEFNTSWQSIINAAEWVRETILTKTVPTIEPKPLCYTIESTSTYHLPIIKGFGGKPSVVNPLLAGSTRRKTDVLDARMLAYQSMTGLWPESFIVSSEIQEFRLLIKQAEYHQRTCAAISNRINNYIMRFGHTLGAYKSMRSSENRALITDMCQDDFVYSENLNNVVNGRYVCPEGLPDTCKKMVLGMYTQYDEHENAMKDLLKDAMKFAKSIEWETDKGMVKGDILIKNLSSIPFVGEKMILYWLCEIVTPLRFKYPKQLAAYCGCDPSLKISAGKVTSHTRRKGNAKLHFILKTIAGTCVNSHSEPIGQWGYNIYKRSSSGSFRKACGAVARRLAISMYYVHKLNEPFSYDKYNFYKVEVPDCFLDEMGFSTRLTKILSQAGYEKSGDIVQGFKTGEIAGLKGLGAKAMGEIEKWVTINKK